MRDPRETRLRQIGRLTLDARGLEGERDRLLRELAVDRTPGKINQLAAMAGISKIRVYQIIGPTKRKEAAE
jgi:hypothetical protein